MERRAVALALIGAFLFGIALSDLPQVHERIHPDANQPQHECAVTLIAHGNCDHAAVTPVLDRAVTAVSCEQIRLRDLVFVEPLFLEASILEHAPPA